MAERPPILRRRRTGVYSVVERSTGTLIGSVMRQATGWWIAVDPDGNRVLVGRCVDPSLYSTRRLAVSELLAVREDRGQTDG